MGPSMGASPSPVGRGAGVREETWSLSHFSLTLGPSPGGRGMQSPTPTVTYDPHESLMNQI